jgi:peptidoglycan hydrolase-like protein with peptidoglycan-binding domain
LASFPLQEAEQFTKPGTANASPADVKRLGPLMKHYKGMAHPFTACKRDQLKHGLSEDHANRRCVAPGTLVQTERGMVEIENLVPGQDRVRTHRGRWRMVRAVLATHLDYEGALVELRPQLSPQPLLLTPDHRVLAIRGEGRFPSGRRRAAIGDLAASGEPEWVEAGELTKDDYIVHPVAREIADCSVSNDELRLLGWYAAEGCASGGRARFCLGPEDEECVALLERLVAVEDQWARRDSVRLHERPRSSLPVAVGGGNCTEWTLASSSLSRWLIESCPGKARTKRFAPWVMALPAERLRHVLEGYVAGDGSEIRSKQDRGIRQTITTASLDLAVQARDMALALGFRPRIALDKKAGPCTIQGREVERGDTWAVNWSLSCGDRRVRNAGLQNHQIIALPIRAIKHVPVVGQRLYDCQVEEDESFSSLYGAVHNCAVLMDLGVKAPGWRSREEVAADLGWTVPQVDGFVAKCREELRILATALGADKVAVVLAEGVPLNYAMDEAERDLFELAEEAICAVQWFGDMPAKATEAYNPPSWVIPKQAKQPGFKPLDPPKKKSGSSSSKYDESKHPRNQGGEFLQKGHTGPAVKGVQQKLGIKVTGTYDKNTVARIRTYQANHNLAVDGIVGSQTAASLLGKSARAPGALASGLRKQLQSLATRKLKEDEILTEQLEERTVHTEARQRDNGVKSASHSSIRSALFDLSDRGTPTHTVKLPNGTTVKVAPTAQPAYGSYGRAFSVTNGTETLNATGVEEAADTAKELDSRQPGASGTPVSST